MIFISVVKIEFFMMLYASFFLWGDFPIWFNPICDTTKAEWQDSKVKPPQKIQNHNKMHQSPEWSTATFSRLLKWPPAASTPTSPAPLPAGSCRRGKRHPISSRTLPCSDPVTNLQASSRHARWPEGRGVHCPASTHKLVAVAANLGSGRACEMYMQVCKLCCAPPSFK